MRKVELLPTRDCEAGYGPDPASLSQTLNVQLLSAHLTDDYPSNSSIY